MASSSRSRSSAIIFSRSFAIAFVTLMLLDTSVTTRASPASIETDHATMQLLNLNRPCDEIYVVGEGETLHTISDKCGDPFILERNPHIYDPDDVFPGLVIKILPSYSRKL